MAEAAPPPLHRGLPDEIAIWEILVRLPPKSLLRCRAVCHAWRRATTARDFLLAHYARQPALPLIYGLGRDIESLDIIPFDHRAGVATADDRLLSVARIGGPYVRPCISCDGLQGLYIGVDQLSIVNPATRQCARLPGFTVTDTHRPVGMYPHSLSGEYRILLAPRDPDDSHQLYTLGSNQPPRPIDIDGRVVDELSPFTPLLFHHSLHWCLDNMTTVFDTTAESFQEVLAPDGADQFMMDEIYGGALFEVDGMLGMSSLNAEFTSVGIWSMHNYESKVWAFKYRVELPLAELTMQFGKFKPYGWGVPSSWDGDVTMLLQFGDWLLQLDMDGKVVASLHRHKGLFPTQHLLKQTLVQHSFFPTLEGYVVNASPFI
ncbi:F-box protein CPR1-like [Aegilops tauschii subsp. strangulata]|uniref:Uncharacterized protein n=1 Tax=Aegilops tauschii TaxID=37682 RepID=M8D9L8_AEGTA|nr:F-box protein CPR1-like [Aegilops tauschii subsp. strangulata]